MHVCRHIIRLCLLCQAELYTNLLDCGQRCQRGSRLPSLPDGEEANEWVFFSKSRFIRCIETIPDSKLVTSEGKSGSNKKVLPDYQQKVVNLTTRHFHPCLHVGLSSANVHVFW